jgi:2-polyprenyl-3-methyl-5-hydroxy-6-metoxy-1,4-benzoquinol methylase
MPTPDQARQSDTLAESTVHEEWEAGYRSEENEAFFEEAFDRFLALVDPPPGARFLDAGCGPGFHSIRLARRGFEVRAIDFSDGVLEMAKANVRAAGLEDRIDVEQKDLVNLDLPTGSESYVLCWGVLMHIPDLEKAIAELARVTAPGGTIIISEANARSLDNRLLRLAARLRGKKVDPHTTFGIESWRETPAGPLLTRHADLDALVEAFSRNGARLEHRQPGQLTELYTNSHLKFLQPTLHRLNSVFARHVRRGGLAFGHVLIFRKGSDGADGDT